MSIALLVQAWWNKQPSFQCTQEDRPTTVKKTASAPISQIDAPAKPASPVKQAESQLRRSISAPSFQTWVRPTDVSDKIIEKCRQWDVTAVDIVRAERSTAAFKAAALFKFIVTHYDELNTINRYVADEERILYGFYYLANDLLVSDAQLIELVKGMAKYPSFSFALPEMMAQVKKEDHQVIFEIALAYENLDAIDYFLGKGDVKIAHVPQEKWSKLATLATKNELHLVFERLALYLQPENQLMLFENLYEEGDWLAVEALFSIEPFRHVLKEKCLDYLEPLRALVVLCTSERRSDFLNNVLSIYEA